MSSALVAPHVRADTVVAPDVAALGEDLNRKPGRADPHLVADHLVRRRVEVVVEDHVVVDVDARLLPLPEREAR